jgi:hypothetical protein
VDDLLGDPGRVVEPRHMAGAVDETKLPGRQHAGDPFPDLDGADRVRCAVYTFLPWVMKMARLPVRVAGFNKLASMSA